MSLTGKTIAVLMGGPGSEREISLVSAKSVSTALRQLDGVTVHDVDVQDANFIVNDGEATATDVLTLIAEIKAKAAAERSIALETEVQILGEDRPTPNQFVR